MTVVEWIGVYTEWLRNAAIVVGVMVAWWQLGNWKREKLSVKRADLGEDLMALAYELSVQIESIRSPFGYGPPDGEEDDGTFDYQRRLKELGELNDEYVQLRRLRARCKALIGNADLETSIDAFFEARGDLVVALQGKIRDIRGGYRMGAPSTERDIERMEKYDVAIWGGGSTIGDPLGKSIKDAVAGIENLMVPIIRFEANK